jgi:hypothetical protein
MVTAAAEATMPVTRACPTPRIRPMPADTDQ